VLAEAERPRDVTLLATGSEVALALAARTMLAAEGIAAAVVSMPCWDLFEEQDQTWRDAVLGTAPRVGVEAAVRLGWDRWIGADGAFVGMSGYGASGAENDLWRHFCITPDSVRNAARCLVNGDG